MKKAAQFFPGFRDVAIEPFRSYVDAQRGENAGPETAEGEVLSPWFGILGGSATIERHDMEAIRDSIARSVRRER